MKKTNLTPEEIQRYSRHLVIPEVGVEGQERLKASKVLIVGTGGLGSPVGIYLAAAGIGRLGLVDFDAVEFSNLHRQVLYSTKDVGKSKIESAKKRLKGINDKIEIITHETRLTSENALEIIKDYDIIVDGTDNFPTRYLVNDACVLSEKPNVYGSIYRFEGQVSVFDAKRGPCYRCLYLEPPPSGLFATCEEGGVLGVLPGIIGNLQAMEVIKLILFPVLSGVNSQHPTNSLIGRLLLFNGLRMEFREVKIQKNPDCPICGKNPTILELMDYEDFCGVGSTGILPVDEWEITVEELKRKLDRGEKIKLLDVREPYENEICCLKGSSLIPLRELPDRIGDLDSTENIVVYCHRGNRSLDAVRYLRGRGFRNVKNLKGGIDVWSLKIDPTVPRY